MRRIILVVGMLVLCILPAMAQDPYDLKMAQKGDKGAMYRVGRAYYSGNGAKQDYKLAVSWLEKAAKFDNIFGTTKGFPEAQNLLGLCYEKGYGVSQDIEQAIYWYKKATEQKNRAAQFNLGFCYSKGNGVPQDYALAVHYFRKSVEGRNSVPAQINLGICYYLGKGVPKNYEQAVYWFSRANEDIYSDALYLDWSFNREAIASSQLALGNCYEKGLGVTQSSIQAVYWYRKSAEQGNSIGQFYLGMCYDTGKGIQKDFVQAAFWYRKAAEQGLSEAQFCLACCYENGDGVSQSYEQAVYWYKKAAELGYSSAQNNLGLCYELGKGCSQNNERAVYWYKKAAECGNSNAQYSLINLLYVHKSAETLHYLLMAYENKDIEKNAKADVAKKISTCYRFGVCGATKSEAEADAWNKKAAELGDSDAKEIEKWLNNTRLSNSANF